MSIDWSAQTVPAHKTHIMVHCLATRKSWAYDEQGNLRPVADIRDEVTIWHTRDRGWSGNGYSAIINYDGEIIGARDLDSDGDNFEEQTAAAKGWNKKAIHIALVGGHGASASDKFSDHFTEKQRSALLETFSEIESIAGRKMKLIGHNEVANKGCPGFNVQEEFGNKKPRTTVLQASTVKAAVGTAASGTASIGLFMTQLDPSAQKMVIGGALVLALAGMFFLYHIFKERKIRFDRGDR